MSAAIFCFSSSGYTISIPITDSQPYDLIVDKGKLERVQVKTTSYKDKTGNYTVNLSTKGGNRTSVGKVKKLNPDDIDLIFVLTDSGTAYSIPIGQTSARYSLTLSSGYEKFICKKL